MTRPVSDRPRRGLDVIGLLLVFIPTLFARCVPKSSTNNVVKNFSRLLS